MKTKTDSIRTIVTTATYRIDRVSDRYYADYALYVAGGYAGSYSTQQDAEIAGDAAALEMAKLERALVDETMSQVAA